MYPYRGLITSIDSTFICHLGQARCLNEFDKEFIHARISEWYGNLVPSAVNERNEVWDLAFISF